MFQIMIAILAITTVAILALTAVFYGAAAFTSKSPALPNTRTVKPFILTKTGKTPVGLQITLALLLVSFVALGFAAFQ
jgi:hypothetical protein